MTTAPRLRRAGLPLAFGLGLALVFAYLVLRSRSLMPWVFADELYYSRGARLLAPGMSILPNHLYFALFRVTSACGNGFLDCARLLNCVIYVAGAPFLYQIARTVCERVVAAIVVLLCLLGPFSVMTGYFMPEAMYFTLFCVFAWAALRWRSLPPLAYGLLTGALLGVMSLVKPHALFLLPALLAFMVYLLWQGAPAQRSWRTALPMLVAAPVALLAVKMGGGYLLAGVPGLSLLGGFYGGMAGNNGIAKILAQLLPMLVSLRAHALALVLLFALPLVALALHASDKRVRAVQTGELRALQVFALLMLGAALGVTVIFTSLLGAASMAELLRVHLRYYDFVFPLLIIVGAAGVTAPAAGVPVSLAKRVALALVTGVLVLLAARYYAPGHFEPTRIDGPELFGFLSDPRGATALTALTLVLLAVWCWRRRVASWLFVLVLLPATVWQGASVLEKALAPTGVQDGFDRAAQATKAYLSKEELSHLVVFGNDGWGGLMRASFELDNINIETRQLDPGLPIALDMMTPRQWTLLIGEHPLPPGVAPAIKNADFTLVKLGGDEKLVAHLDFSEELPGPYLASATGLSWSEKPWGRWSDAPQVRLETREALPKKLSLFLHANAFVPNAGADMVISVGAQKRIFRISTAPEKRYFTFDTDGTEHVITIDVPHPVSPKSIGMNTDLRTIGIRMVELDIGSRQ